MDDGTIVRLAEELYYVTTTSSGADSVTAWFEWWNAVWGYEARDRQRHGRAGGAEPRRARGRARLCSGSPSTRSRTRSSRTSMPSSSRSPGSPASRCGSASSASSATSCTSRAPPPSTSGTGRRRGRACPSGSSQRILRLEKGHVIVGQDTDSETNMLSAAMPWLPIDKDDFVGKLCAGALRTRASRSSGSSASSMEDGVVPAEGAQVVDRGLTGGPRHERAPQRSGRTVIGLAWLPVERAEDGARFRSGSTGNCRRPREVRSVLRRRRNADALVSAARLSLTFALRGRRDDVRRCAERSRGCALGRSVQDLSAGRRRSRSAATSSSSTPRPGEELVRLTPRRGFLFTGERSC